LQTSDDLADQSEEDHALVRREPRQRLGVHRLGRRRRHAFECARLFSQPDTLRAPVGGVLAALDQPVALHARQGVGHLIPALAATGGSGLALARERAGPLIERKRRRMPVIAANGLLILVPSALFLSFKSQAGEFDGFFYGVQALELIAGAVNIALLGLNLRDGLRARSRAHQTT